MQAIRSYLVALALVGSLPLCAADAAPQLPAETEQSSDAFRRTISQEVNHDEEQDNAATKTAAEEPGFLNTTERKIALAVGLAVAAGLAYAGYNAYAGNQVSPDLMGVLSRLSLTKTGALRDRQALRDAVNASALTPEQRSATVAAITHLKDSVPAAELQGVYDTLNSLSNNSELPGIIASFQRLSK